MGRYISKFTGEDIDRRLEEVDSKTAVTYFDASNYTLYAFKSESDKENWLNGGGDSYVLTSTPFNFTGTMNQVKVVNLMDSTNLAFTTTNNTAILRMTFTSQQKGITDTQWEDVAEDFRVTVLVDKGATGTWEHIVEDKLVLNGQNYEIDVKKYIATGYNRIRISAKGVVTETVGNLIYSVNLTTMYLAPSKFTWNVPFVEGKAYSLGGLNIGGNLNKVLKIHVTGNEYDKLYEVNIGTNTYTTNAYYFTELTFPDNGTGVYHFELWLDANGLESDHLNYDILCVASADAGTAQYVVINDAADKVMNGSDGKVFAYSLYNKGGAKGNASVSITIGDDVLISDTLTDVSTGTIIYYNANVEYETESGGLMVTASITSGNTATVILPLDNSASFPATTGASFYLNAATRNNSQDNRSVVVNEVDGSEVNVTWTDVSYVDGMDGWTIDDEGRKCLLIPATSKAVVDYKPLGTYGTGKTIELAFKVANAADYTEDIIRFATSTASDFMGVRIKPNNIVLHSNLLRDNDITQGYNLKDEEFVHVLITIVKNYKTNYGNLAQIYVNGVKKCSFEFSGTDSWINQSTIELGSQTADLYLYKMRVYEIGFGWQDATRNFISCLADAASKKAAHDKMMSCIDDSYKLDYNKVKGKYNTFVVEMLGNNPLPSYQVNNKDYAAPCNFWIDIIGVDTLMNGEFLNEEIEGQGTTSMDYWRWNLRSKTDNIRITAKKNYASSMHSHKMGATALFNDLYKIVVGENEAGGDVAVTQYPVYGFQKILVDGTTDQYIYEPIGLYTIGADKGDKPTFGYDNPEYKNTLIHMEGSDHSPKSVGMDYPWAELTYSASVESLGAKNANGKAIAAWEVGACMGLATDEASDESAVLSALTQEWGPAYDCDYKNTTMIVGVSSIADVNADIPTFQRTPSDNGFTNGDCLVWVDGEYDTYYYNVVSQTYVKDGLNILTDLGISASDLNGMTIEEKNNHFRTLRRERYKASMESYWHLRDNLFQYCFLTLFAATDNFKKNSYPYKFGTLASGSRWRWRQDDLDTLFDIDNQGLANKIYSILNGDTAEGSTTQLFRGNSSYHWVLIKECYEAEINAMYIEILEAMATLSPYGTSNIDKVIGCVRAYFWDKAQEYFPMSAYNADAEWSYEDAWPHYTDGTYEVGVHPLRQSLGSHYEAERAWVTYRLIFMASMVGFGPFAVDNQTDRSLGQISFRPSGTNTFQFTPAIDMNPTVLIGASDAKSAGERVKAGDTAELVVSVGSDGDTTTYLQAADYMQDIGDLSKLAVNENNPSLNISSKRLQRIKVGDESAANVTTLLKTLGIGACPSLMEIEARNLPTLTGEIDLTRCPRLKKAMFGGTSVSAIQLPSGSKVSELDLPSTLLNLSLVNLPKLTEEGLTYPNFTALTYLRVEGGNIEGFGLLKAAMSESGALENIRVIGFDYDGDATDVDLLAELANGGYYGINENGEIDNTIIPVLEGVLNVDGYIYEDKGNIVKENFPNITLNVSGGCYVRFADPEVQRIVAENWGDGIGTSLEQIQAVTSIGTVFSGNTVIETFDEFGEFTNVAEIAASAFEGDESLTSISFPNITNIGDSAFKNCSSLELEDLNLPDLLEIGQDAFYNTKIKKIKNLGSITSLSDDGSNYASGVFNTCGNLTEVILPETLTKINGGSFTFCESLEYIKIPDNVSLIGKDAFARCDLKLIEFGTGINSILENSFGFNMELSVVICNAETPPQLWNKVFQGITNQFTIYVPDASVEAYKTATNWSAYADRIMSKFYYLGYIDFADSAVRDICVANFDTDADGVISIEEAAAVTDIGTIFANNTEITSFDEFKYFTGVTTLAGGSFQSSSIQHLRLPETMVNAVFYYPQYLKSINVPKSITSFSLIKYTHNTPLDYVIWDSELLGMNGKFSQTYVKEWRTNNTSKYYIDKGSIYSSDKTTLYARGYSDEWNILDSVTILHEHSCGKLDNGGVITLSNIREVYNIAFKSVTADILDFSGCTSLNLQSGAFREGNVETIKLPQNVSMNVGLLFYGNTSTQKLVMYAETPPQIQVFANSSIANGACIIYVPDNSVDAYKTASVWEQYADQIKPLSEYVEE